MVGVLPISRYDALLYDITLEETDADTGVAQPVVEGSVTAFLSLWPPSLTGVNESAVSLHHVGEGRWIGELVPERVAIAMSTISNGTPVAVIYTLNGAMVRYREATAVAIRRVEAL